MADNKNGELVTYNKKELAAVRKAITDKHKHVSGLTTPSPVSYTHLRAHETDS